LFERKNGYAQHVARSLINKQPLALTYTMEKASATVDSIFRGLNYQLENIAVDDDDDDVSEEDFRLNKDTSIGIDWKTLLMGELDNKQHAVAKAKAEAASIERRQLRKLKKMMEAERRAKEKVQKMAIRAYLKKKQLLKNFELSTIMSRKPLNSEKTSTVGVMENQRRRHLLTKMLSGDEFNSLERPAGMGKIKNRALEPVLLSQLPAHTKQISSQSDANWVEHQNVENLRNIKKIVQKQRIMKLKNSDFSHDPVKNIAMQKKKFGGPKILAHASLLRSYNANGLNP